MYHSMNTCTHMYMYKNKIEIQTRGWGHDTAVKDIACCRRGPRFSYQTPVSPRGSDTRFWPFAPYMHMVYKHAYRKDTHASKIK